VLPIACVAADVAADAVEVTAESAGAAVDAVELAAGALGADPDPVGAETADWPVVAAWPTAGDRSAATEDVAVSAATEEVVVATPPPALPWAVEVPGLAAAEADFAVRRDKPMATPIAAMAMPAAHTQNRRTLVTSPLVTTVTLIGPGYFCLAH